MPDASEPRPARSPIIPTIGRIVLVRSNFAAGDFPAIITGVGELPDVIDVTAFPRGGLAQPLSNLVYEEDHDNSQRSVSWRWMDYQKAVAKQNDPVSGAAIPPPSA